MGNISAASISSLRSELRAAAHFCCAKSTGVGGRNLFGATVGGAKFLPPTKTDTKQLLQNDAGWIIIRGINRMTENHMKKTESDEDIICAMCEHGTPLFTGDAVLCRRHGLVKPTSRCRRFRYDPLKRSIRPTPPLPTLDFSDLI